MKCCLWCKHLYFDGGTQGYGPQTPGSDMALRCQKNHWDAFESMPAEFFELMATARTCPDYALNKEITDLFPDAQE